MNVTSSVAFSGMSAAQTELQASAQNIANIETQNFTRQEVTQRTATGGGTLATVRSSANPGNNLEADMLQQLQAKNTYLANLSVFKSNNGMIGTLLNITA